MPAVGEGGNIHTVQHIHNPAEPSLLSPVSPSHLTALPSSGTECSVFQFPDSGLGLPIDNVMSTQSTQHTTSTATRALGHSPPLCRYVTMGWDGAGGAGWKFRDPGTNIKRIGVTEGVKRRVDEKGEGKGGEGAVDS